jgi:nitric oxide reductase activation protein
MAVYILIDKSGSMSRNNGRGKRNDQCAAETAICLCEALRALRIPVYITGFTTRGSKALHMHYVTWNSPQSDRYTLANFAADDCNYDYYSIMEATRILKKRNAKHKLLIVISDGAPCNVMHGGNRMDPISATATAITEARKTTDVLGVALNCFDESAYKAMYGKDYITVSTANDMFLPISETIQRIVKSW